MRAPLMVGEQVIKLFRDLALNEGDRLLVVRVPLDAIASGYQLVCGSSHHALSVCFKEDAKVVVYL